MKFKLVKMKGMDSDLKKNIRQDLQDYLDSKAFGLRVARRRRKKSP